MGVSETILVAMIGAGATVLTALVQIIVSFNKAASSERRNSRSRVRSLMWMFALMLAAGAGGFAYAEYRALESRDETRALRDELKQQMTALTASTARLEQLRMTNPGAAGAPAADASTATVALPACKGAQVGFATTRGPCAEQDAVQVAVCAPVPATARVTAVELFARAEDSQQPWTEARMTAGQVAAAGRFADNYFERPDSDGTRLVCQNFAHWNSEKGRAVRILVRYGA
jgi:hypothetical protein